MKTFNFNFSKYFIRIFCFFISLLLIYFFLKFSIIFNNSKKNQIRIFAFSDHFSEESIADFEKKYKIKVLMNYYDSNEELLTKIKLMNNKKYDLIIGSNYIFENMKKYNFLKKIDKSKLKKNIKIKEYRIPLYFDFYVIGYNKKMIQNNFEKSWNSLFSENLNSKIGLIDESRDLFSILNYYLNYYSNNKVSNTYNSKNKNKDINKEDLNKIIQFLKKYDKNVGAYNDYQQGYYLATETYPLVLSQRTFLAREKLNDLNIDFFIPKEGTLPLIDNVLISNNTKKDDLIYKFINYIFEPEVLLKNCECFCLIPYSKSVLKNLDKKYIGIENIYKIINSKKKYFETFIIQQNYLPDDLLNNCWINIKS